MRFKNGRGVICEQLFSAQTNQHGSSRYNSSYILEILYIYQVSSEGNLFKESSHDSNKASGISGIRGLLKVLLSDYQVWSIQTFVANSHNGK